MKEWWRSLEPLLTPDQHALYNNQVPRGLLDYTPLTEPDALLSEAAGGTTGITESAVQTRVALILQIRDVWTTG